MKRVQKDSRRFVARWWTTGLDHLSLGVHVCLGRPNLEIHLPFGFLRLGWEIEPACFTCANDCDPYTWSKWGNKRKMERAQRCRIDDKHRRFWSGASRCVLWKSKRSRKRRR